jgi:WD40 repeat protein
VTALAFNPSGERLITGTGVPSRSGELKLWNTADWTVVAENDEAHEDTITSFTFSPYGKQVASGSTDRMVKIFDAETLEYQKTFEGHTSHVLDVAWNADGLDIASASADKQVKIWNVAEGQQKQKIEGYDKEITSIEYVADNTTLLTASGDKTLKLSNAPLPEAGDTFLHTCAASPDGTIIIAGGQDGVLRVWDGIAKKLLSAFESPGAEAAKVATQ